MSTLAPAPQLLHKNLPVSGVKVLDDKAGIVEAFVAGIGNKDSMGDIIQPGAFKDSLSTRMPKGVWSHNWDLPVAKTLEIYEVLPGDHRLPLKMATRGTGGLYVKCQFNLGTQRGSDAYSDVKFFGEESEWSIGYMEVDTEPSKELEAKLLHKVDLYEYSPVLFGANPLTSTVSVKVAQEEEGLERSIEVRIAGIESKDIEDRVRLAIKDAIDGTNDAVRVETTLENVFVVEAGATTEDVVKIITEIAEERDQKLIEAIKEGVVDEAKEAEPQAEKAIPGSLEARYGAIASALAEAHPGGAAVPVATFDGSVVYEVASADPEASGTFSASYTLDENGGVLLGEATPVDVVEVVIARSALQQAASRGIELPSEFTQKVEYPAYALTFDGQSKTTTTNATITSFWAEPETSWECYIPLPSGNSGKARSRKILESVAASFDLEMKAGRVLSAKNVGHLKDAIAAIESVLGSGDAKEPEAEEKSEPITTEEKAVEVDVEEKATDDFDPHKFVDENNDGKCDDCGKEVDDEDHVDDNPESGHDAPKKGEDVEDTEEKKPHPFLPGGDDGTCRICGKPKADHKTAEDEEEVEKEADTPQLVEVSSTEILELELLLAEEYLAQ